jgi:hypothetical protein
MAVDAPLFVSAFDVVNHLRCPASAIAHRAEGFPGWSSRTATGQLARLTLVQLRSQWAQGRAIDLNDAVELAMSSLGTSSLGRWLADQPPAARAGLRSDAARRTAALSEMIRRLDDVELDHRVQAKVGPVVFDTRVDARVQSSGDSGRPERIGLLLEGPVDRLRAAQMATHIVVTRLLGPRPTTPDVSVFWALTGERTSVTVGDVERATWMDAIDATVMAAADAANAARRSGRFCRWCPARRDCPDAAPDLGLGPGLPT